MNMRSATPEDAPAIAAIYAPIVRGTTISFELVPPTADEMRSRILSTLKGLPWLVSLDAIGAISGYAYASKHRERAAYQWSVDVSAYVRDDCRGQGIGKRLYERLFQELVDLGYYQAFAGIALPNEASVALHESVGFRPRLCENAIRMTRAYGGARSALSAPTTLHSGHRLSYQAFEDAPARYGPF
jgi:L-amino acid N-acyltransferase YncA